MTTTRGRPSGTRGVADVVHPSVRRGGWVRWTAAGLVLGALLALGCWTAQPPRWQSTATVVLTGDGAPGRGSLLEINGQAQNIVATVAAVAESDIVSDGVARQLGRSEQSLRDSVSAEPRVGTLVIDLRVSATREDGLVAVTDAIATETAEQALALQVADAGSVRTRVDIVSSATEPVDAHHDTLDFVLVIGLLLGGGLGAFAAVLRRPLRAAGPSTWDLDAELRAELAGWSAASRRWRVRLAVASAGLLLLAYAATSVTLPLLLLGLALAAGAVRDLRYAAVGSLLLGLGAPDPRVTFLPVGALTISIQDVLLLAGVAGVAWRWWTTLPARPRSEDGPRLFGPAVLAFAGAVVSGALVGLVRGADHSELAEPVRVMVVLPAVYLLFRHAYAGRPAQLLLTLLACSFVSSSLVLLAVPLGWTALLSDVRDYVVTGSSEASVTRLADPVLASWSVLLVVLAAGVAVGTRRGWWLLAALPGAVHVALSFNRSTWAPLVVLVVLAAGMRGGVLGVLRRAVAVAVLGSIGLAVALSGSLGPQAEQLGSRALSAVTGAATAEDSLRDRLIEDEAAVATLQDDPVLGTGVGRPYGGLSVAFDPALDATVVVQRPFIHNQYYRLWLLLGVPGLAAVTWLVVSLGSAVVLLTRTVGTRRAAVPIAVALGVLCTGLQGIFQTNLIDRPTMMLTGLSLALVEICVRSCARPGKVPPMSATRAVRSSP